MFRTHNKFRIACKRDVRTFNWAELAPLARRPASAHLVDLDLIINHTCCVSFVRLKYRQLMTVERLVIAVRCGSRIRFRVSVLRIPTRLWIRRRRRRGSWLTSTGHFGRKQPHMAERLTDHPTPIIIKTRLFHVASYRKLSRPINGASIASCLRDWSDNKSGTGTGVVWLMARTRQ
jgi:hypothetical protein